MDNCQHFVAVFLPRILCSRHNHLTVLPSASLPYIKHSRFGPLQAGVKDGNLTEIYHRFLHETRNLVWQNSKYCEESPIVIVRQTRLTNIPDFIVNEDYVPSCATLTENPYSAVSRLIRGNFPGRHVERCAGRVEDQKSVTWRDYKQQKTVRRLGKQEEGRLFGNVVWPPGQGTAGTWLMHHIKDWTETLGWTPQMFNEWLLANEDGTSLLISFPEHYFYQRKPMLSRASLALVSVSGSSGHQSSVAAPETWCQDMLDATSDICLDLEEGQCSCSTCEDRTLAQAVFESVKESQRMARFRQEADDEVLAQLMTEHEKDASTDRYRQLWEDERLAQAIMTQHEEEVSTSQHRQLLEDERLARAMSEHENVSIDVIRAEEREQIALDLELARSYAHGGEGSGCRGTASELGFETTVWDAWASKSANVIVGEVGR
jgi:hypothetical protein